MSLSPIVTFLIGFLTILHLLQSIGDGFLAAALDFGDNAGKLAPSHAGDAFEPLVLLPFAGKVRIRQRKDDTAEGQRRQKWHSIDEKTDY